MNFRLSNESMVSGKKRRTHAITSLGATEVRHASHSTSEQQEMLQDIEAELALEEQSAEADSSRKTI